MTPDERMEIARILKDRVYGADAPDIRESEREAGRPRDLDDLEHLPP